MAILESVLKEELDRMKRMSSAYSEEINLLPKGSIVKKRIGSKYYNYLQFRSGGKVVSKYIKEANLDEVRNKIERRKNLSQAIKRMEKDMAKIEKVLK